MDSIWRPLVEKFSILLWFSGFTKEVVFAIYIAVVQCTCLELIQRSVAPLVLKFGIHQGQA
jgi:hypothetical protein